MSALSLPILLRSLGLTTMAREHDEALARAETEDWGYPRLLRHLVETEVNMSANVLGNDPAGA